MTGYRDPGYARSFSGLGTPRELPRSGGWILVREIPDTGRRDGMGCYPLFSCRDTAGLAADLEEAGRDLVALSLVTDPFCDFGGEEALREVFPDLARPYKEHFVVDLAVPLGDHLSDHHRRNARRALQLLTVERIAAPAGDPAALLDEWHELYGHLVERHQIQGIAAFSRAAFEEQLRVPGMVAFRALHGDTPVGMSLWYRQGDVALYHLGAYAPAGYALRASFALFQSALEHFAAEGVRWAGLGAGAGVHGTGSGGLTRFKQGWATGTRTAWLCGRIFDREAYAELSARIPSESGYFPAYRSWERG
jgi:hypothetical protein